SVVDLSSDPTAFDCPRLVVCSHASVPRVPMRCELRATSEARAASHGTPHRWTCGCGRAPELLRRDTVQILQPLGPWRHPGERGAPDNSGVRRGPGPGW